jgi:hypothetical protein
MPHTEKNSKQPSSKPRSDKDPISEQRLEKDADEMASEAEKVEKQYDQDHDIFTK